MNKQKVIRIIAVLVSAALAYGAFRGWRMYSGAQNLTFDIQGFGVPKVSATEQILPLQIKAINPSDETYTVKHPTVKMYAEDGNTFATSLPRDENLTIPKRGEVVFPMEIRLSTKDTATNLWDIGQKVLKDGTKALKNPLAGQKFKFDISTAWYGLPINITGYEKQF